jgi:hypothetical protein
MTHTLDFGFGDEVDGVFSHTAHNLCPICASASASSYIISPISSLRFTEPGNMKYNVPYYTYNIHFLLLSTSTYIHTRE